MVSRYSECSSYSVALSLYTATLSRKEGGGIAPNWPCHVLAVSRNTGPLSKMLLHVFFSLFFHFSFFLFRSLPLSTPPLHLSIPPCNNDCSSCGPRGIAQYRATKGDAEPPTRCCLFQLRGDFQGSYPAEVRRGNFSPFFSAKGVVKFGVNFGEIFRATFSRVGVCEENFTESSLQKRCEKRSISRKFHSAGVQR